MALDVGGVHAEFVAQMRKLKDEQEIRAQQAAQGRSEKTVRDMPDARGGKANALIALKKWKRFCLESFQS